MIYQFTAKKSFKSIDVSKKKLDRFSSLVVMIKG